MRIAWVLTLLVASACDGVSGGGPPDAGDAGLDSAVVRFDADPPDGPACRALTACCAGMTSCTEPVLAGDYSEAQCEAMHAAYLASGACTGDAGEIDSATDAPRDAR